MALADAEPLEGLQKNVQGFGRPRKMEGDIHSLACSLVKLWYTGPGVGLRSAEAIK